jgi:hypothetical protein
MFFLSLAAFQLTGNCVWVGYALYLNKVLLEQDMRHIREM